MPCVSDDPFPLSRAILLQLNAEITAHDTSAKEVAGRIGKDYNTFRRYLTGERELPVTVLSQALDAIGIDPVVFMTRARDRARESRP